MKRWWLSLFVLVPSLIFVGVEGRSIDKSPFDQTKELTVMRNIGHLVLLSSGDSSSRVLPVEKMAEGRFLLRFEKPFQLNSDSLVNIFKSQFSGNTNFSVELKDCRTDNSVYSFIISRDSINTIIPCLNREIPAGCYSLLVQISQPKALVTYYITALAALVLAFSAWLIFRRKKHTQSVPGPTVPEAPEAQEAEEETVEEVTANFISVGRFRFYPQQQKLVLDNHVTELTGKESQLLHILAGSPNVVVDRNRLQKEIWEDEGVIVTRSLDMFVSKLRKKLKEDDSIKIVNVHGKGYRLEFRNSEHRAPSSGDRRSELD